MISTALFLGKPAYGKTGDTAGRSSLKKYKTVIQVKSMAGKRIERIDSLLELGLLKEAVSEIIHVSKKPSSIDDMEYLCAKLQELGQYKHSVRLAVKVRGARELDQFLYPLAHWDIVEGLSEKFGIDPFLVLAVVREESRFDEEARSSAGAMGLMQLMPGTAYRFDKKLRLGIKNSHDILDVKNNLSVGALYLGSLVDGTVLVVKSGETPRKALLEVKEIFRNINAKVLGVVLNGVKEKDLRYGHYNYYSSYYRN